MSRLITKGLRTLCGGPFSFAVNRGTCVAFSGPSGCGKTLLLRALADLDPPEGSVWLDGISRENFSPPEWRRKVGWLPAESVWWFDTVREHFRKLRREASDSAGELRILEKLGFEPDVLNWSVDRLSTGEKQRLALFRLLLNQPQVLLLDEPTAALDPANVQRAEEVITRYRTETGAAVLWVSHDSGQAARMAESRFVFSKGALEPANE